ncbi:hypothetical protein [Streptomyces sp. NBC_01445]|uniref:hypothetical protein n=1 Tax=Streptomyces sp. NBC_01445 TaxID=2903869 RepID=UPI002DDA24A9|nr:hypothetical protein [Streptomyces sp. NBC_01445]WSE02194.1 hypothetical protein OG574_01425 [Streptomyces sp. NBC_01445]
MLRSSLWRISLARCPAWAHYTMSSATWRILMSVCWEIPDVPAVLRAQDGQRDDDADRPAFPNGAG